ncbi:MAG: ATP-binding protein, partial [Desulfobacteraceae bacterium]|nr:ATP-binding protein [Desulfobacteraceae bacterium]
MKRHYFSLLEEYLDAFPCVAILGVRQCGKTTLLKMLPEKWKIYDLEKISDHQLISQDPDLFLDLNKTNIAIDESQLFPGLFPALRAAIDADRSMVGRYVVTGSSSPDLLNKISESLAGRIGIIELSPLSLPEAYEAPTSVFFDLLATRTRPEDMPEAMMDKLGPRINSVKIHGHWLKGGYPEPWIRNTARFHKLWMQNYIGTYLNRDIVQLFPGLNHQKYRLFLQMLSNLSGTIINYSHVARSLGVSQPTVRDYFTIAHGTFLWRTIPAYEKNATKRIVKHPKGYVRDTGLLHFMLHQYTLDDLMVHPAMGGSWEALVIETLIRGLNAKGLHFDYFYYRTGAGAEIDLILEGEFGLIPIEIKRSEAVSARELRTITDFVNERKCEYGMVINA